jgi:hypothetical protein
VERFRYGERVRVADPRHHLYERVGVVTRVRDADGAAVVEMDKPIPYEAQLVLQGIRYERSAILFPGHCERLRR